MRTLELINALSLIDGKRLTELMIEHTVGVRSSRVLEFQAARCRFLF